ncbi:hypothetical protein H7698_00500 [Pseudomonas sp. p50]|nr:hypothetical protein [Pseudomonas sp. p50(2008)]
MRNVLFDPVVCHSQPASTPAISVQTPLIRLKRQKAVPRASPFPGSPEQATGRVMMTANENLSQLTSGHHRFLEITLLMY